MPRPHPPEFRRRAVELVRLREKPVAKIAEDLGISDSCLRGWVHQAGEKGGRGGTRASNAALSGVPVTITAHRTANETPERQPRPA
jgi:transposase